MCPQMYTQQFTMEYLLQIMRKEFCQKTGMALFDENEKLCERVFIQKSIEHYLLGIGT